MIQTYMKFFLLRGMEGKPTAQNVPTVITLKIKRWSKCYTNLPKTQETLAAALTPICSIWMAPGETTCGKAQTHR